MKKAIFPVFANSPIISARKSTFLGADRNEVVTVEAPGGIMRSLAEACDGRRSLDQILDSLKSDWDLVSVRELINKLIHNRILIEAQDVTEEIWKLVERPIGGLLELSEEEKALMVNQAASRQREGQSVSQYSVTPTAYTKLLSARKSTRSFEGTVDLQSIVNILWSAYGETGGRRTVPSAGALYPLSLHIVLFQKTGDLESAVYKVNLTSPGTVGLEFVSADTNHLKRSFLDPMMLEGAHGVIVVSGSFPFTSKKYGTRSLLFAPLEAGHVAQNAHVAAAEHGVATVEIGGFREHLLKKVVHLPKDSHPFTTIVFGVENRDPKPLDSKIELRWDTPVGDHYLPPFAIASARVIGRQSWSHGRDSSPKMAYTKAVSEAKEWASCGCVPDALSVAKRHDLETAIDPESVIRFHPRQYHIPGFPFQPLRSETKYAWTAGRDEETGEVAHVLADHVYFPYFPKTPYYAFANSSGVAAHPNRQTALKTATLELVERDSFMLAYLTRLEFPTIEEQSLPQSIQIRIKDLKKIGFRVWIKDHSIDLAPAVFVLAQSDERECTTCASCSSFDIEHAVDHALMEVEASVLARVQNGKVERITPPDVVMPLDHGKLYSQKRYMHRADFLVSGRSQITFRSIGRRVAGCWPELLERFRSKGWRLITVPLHLSPEKGGGGDLKILRSIVPGMVPMTFGNRQEPAGMERIYYIADVFGKKRLNYEGLTKFPHPFE